MGEQKNSFTMRVFKETTQRMVRDVKELLGRKWIKGIEGTLVGVRNH